MVEAPTPPFIQAKYYEPGTNGVIKRIVIHSTVSDTYVGAAESIARYFQNPTYISSAHYAIDPALVYQMVNDWDTAWHDGTNYNSLGLEMCEIPSQDINRWNSQEHTMLLENTADLVRQLCLAYDVPMRQLNEWEIRQGKSGICGHDDMAAAYPARTSHWDPGAFPWKRFMDLVREEDDLQFSSTYTDWAGNTQSLAGTLNRLDRHIWSILNNSQVTVDELTEPYSSTVEGSSYEAVLGQMAANADGYGYRNAKRLDELEEKLDKVLEHLQK